jgi:hypothetical protein
MISVRVDSIGQLIDLKIDQQVEEADLQRVLAEVKAGVGRMRSGWVMASDFRGLVVVNPALNKYIVEIQKTLLAAAPRKIATLVDSHVLKLQLRVGSDAAQSKDVTQRFDNEPQWLAYIAKP